MELSRFNEVMGTKEVMMQTGKEQKKSEIIVKGVKPRDNQVVGPTLGIVDREGNWYNTKKKDWAKFPGAWEQLTALQPGERLDLTYEERPWAKDGKSGVSKDIIGFEKVLRQGDEVRPVPEPGLPRKTTANIEQDEGATPRDEGFRIPPQSRDDSISKLALLKAGAEMAAAQIRAGAIGELSAPDEVAIMFAKKMFSVLHEAW